LTLMVQTVASRLGIHVVQRHLPTYARSIAKRQRTSESEEGSPILTIDDHRALRTIPVGQSSKGTVKQPELHMSSSSKNIERGSHSESYSEVHSESESNSTRNEKETGVTSEVVNELRPGYQSISGRFIAQKISQTNARLTCLQREMHVLKGLIVQGGINKERSCESEPANCSKRTCYNPVSQFANGRRKKQCSSCIAAGTGSKKRRL
jgi:hypothetical protein